MEHIPRMVTRGLTIKKCPPANRPMAKFRLGSSGSWKRVGMRTSVKMGIIEINTNAV